MPTFDGIHRDPNTGENTYLIGLPLRRTFSFQAGGGHTVQNTPAIQYMNSKQIEQHYGLPEDKFLAKYNIGDSIEVPAAQAADPAAAPDKPSYNGPANKPPTLGM